MNRCNTYYSLSSPLDTSLQGVTSDEDLERLSQKLEKWKTVGRHLEIVVARLTAFNNENIDWSEKDLQKVITLAREGGLSCNTLIRHLESPTLPLPSF